MNKRNIIGIITWHYYNNFGSALQSFALQEAISKEGYKVEIINYINPTHGSAIRRLSQILLYFSLGFILKRYRTNFGRFLFSYKYLRKSTIVTDERKLKKLSERYNTIVCGSDQIWAPNCYNPVYFAMFSTSKSRKVSYAASIGLNNIPEDLIPEYKKHLEDFYMVSVREEEGRLLLKDKCNIESTVVLDPTLLHDSAFYKRIERKVSCVKGNYLFCYFLNKNHQYKDRVVKYAQKYGLQIVGVSEKTDDDKWMTKLSDLGADHFVWLINHAQAVMTDSYHGTIFSLLFRKQFWTFARFSENDPICQNSRIRQLQYYFGKNIRVVRQYDGIDESVNINYHDIDHTLNSLRTESICFLKKALK